MKSSQMLADGSVEILVYGPIGGFTFEDDGTTAAGMSRILAAHPDSDVMLRIHSVGGDALEGEALRSILARHKGTVRATVDGRALSAASLVLMAAKEIAISTGGFIMIHDPIAFTMGGAARHESRAAELQSLTQSVADVYASRTGQDKDLILAKMAAETWFSASAAVEFGMADTIVETPAVDPQAQASGDTRILAAYRNVPPTMSATRAPRAQSARTEGNLTLSQSLAKVLSLQANASDESIVASVTEHIANSLELPAVRAQLSEAQTAATVLQTRIEKAAADTRAAECETMIAAMQADGRILPNDTEKSELFRTLYASDPSMATRVSASWHVPAALGARQSTPAQNAGSLDTAGSVSPVAAYGAMKANSNMRHMAESIENSPGETIEEQATAWFKANPVHAARAGVN